MIMNYKEYRNKVLGCWMGKNIGGTLGAPFEWKRQINDVKFYIQELDGNPLPNDDLDLQLVWLVALEEIGLDINAITLGDYWMHYITPHWAEYGIAKANMKVGLVPPLSGISNNVYKDSCGAFIRSEIWACISPGCPEMAVRYAYEDAIVDHGDGEGVHAEVFCAALESAAFIEKDLYKLFDIGLSYIPENCAVAEAINYVIELYRLGKTWLEARDLVIKRFHSGSYFFISEAEVEKGFLGGRRGWEAPSNIGIVIIGLLYGKYDFGDSLCIAVNCGEDTDCTAATIGSILGIINGLEAIPEKWVKPIGKNIKTMCLNLGEIGAKIPNTIYDLTDRVENLTTQAILKYNLNVELSEHKQTDITDLNGISLYAGNKIKEIYKYSKGPLFRFDFFNIYVNYYGDAFIRDNTPKKVTLLLENTYVNPENLSIHWFTPDNWVVSPSKYSLAYISHESFNSHKEFEYEILIDKIESTSVRAVVELTVVGKAKTMLVPIVFINGNCTC